jgi:hypothetical protein
VEHREELTFARLVGSVYSTMSPDARPAGAGRGRFERELRDPLGAAGTFAGDVRVSLLAGRA